MPIPPGVAAGICVGFHGLPQPSGRTGGRTLLPLSPHPRSRRKRHTTRGGRAPSLPCSAYCGSFIPIVVLSQNSWTPSLGEYPSSAVIVSVLVTGVPAGVVTAGGLAVMSALGGITTIVMAEDVTVAKFRSLL